MAIWVGRLFARRAGGCATRTAYNVLFFFAFGRRLAEERRASWVGAVYSAVWFDSIFTTLCFELLAQPDVEETRKGRDGEGLSAAFDGVERFIPYAGFDKRDDASVAVDMGAGRSHALGLGESSCAAYAFDADDTDSRRPRTGPSSSRRRRSQTIDRRRAAEFFGIRISTTGWKKLVPRLSGITKPLLPTAFCASVVAGKRPSRSNISAALLSSRSLASTTSRARSVSLSASIALSMLCARIESCRYVTQARSSDSCWCSATRASRVILGSGRVPNCVSLRDAVWAVKSDSVRRAKSS